MFRWQTTSFCRALCMFCFSWLAAALITLHSGKLGGVLSASRKLRRPKKRWKMSKTLLTTKKNKVNKTNNKSVCIITLGIILTSTLTLQSYLILFITFANYNNNCTIPPWKSFGAISISHDTVEQKNSWWVVIRLVFIISATINL